MMTASRVTGSRGLRLMTMGVVPEREEESVT